MDPVSITLLFLFILNTFAAANTNPTHFTDDVSISCGSTGTSVARDGREWQGDVQIRFSSRLQIKGYSTASRVIHKLIAADDPVPHKTARVSRSQFSYAFRVNPGQKILRLHFNPALYKGFKRFKDLFTVEAGPFTLLSNFSASLTANALGVSSFVKEYYIDMQENQPFNIVLSPSSSQPFDTYAFINGIEIISLPSTLSYFHGGDIGLQEVGKSLVYVENSTALEIIHQLNLRQDSVPSAGDIRYKFGIWETTPKQKPSKMKNITWKTSVDVGFRYLVRLHFSSLGLQMAETGGVIFKVSINEMVANTNIHVCRERDDENSIPMYRDYMVMMKGSKQEGKRDLLICLESNAELIDGYGPFKGFEIMKLSNTDNSLASPNSFSSVQDSPYQTLQNLYDLLGGKNMIANVVIILLALANIVIYTLRQIWEARCTVERNMLSARAQRLCRRFSLAEIQLATRNFSDAHLIGKGGFGKVYKGVVSNGQETLAIKRLKSNSKQGAREFLTEIETLTELQHVNLVSLIGYCNEHSEMILVYEYMACGTLADHLYKLGRSNDNDSPLTWKQCLTICVGAGRGLDYLHTGNLIIHRDVKASNILLDENYTAKVSDFGLAKHLSRSKLQSHVSTKVKGTYGYFDPSYLTTGRLTKESDVYAFGVVLLEVLSGRPPVDPLAPEDQRILIFWARENINKGKAEQIVASNLRGEISEGSLKTFVKVAERCLHDEPRNRPTMAQVVLQLELALKHQERSQFLVSNGITSDANDFHPSNQDKRITSNLDDIHSDGEETNLSDSTRKQSSTDVQNPGPPLKEHTSSNVVSMEHPSARKDRRKSPAHKSSRLWPWDAFWNRVKPSGKNELLLSDNRATETERKDKEISNMPPITVPIPLDELKDKQTVNMLPVAISSIPFDEMKEITGNFSSNCLIGKGSKGKVYHGVLKSGQAAAIRKLHRSKQPDQESLAQFSMVSSLKHENVVELLGYWVNGGLRVLAYEFTSHGSLHELLHKPVPVLSWAQRVKLSVGAAKGLEFIHDKAQIHGDIKSGNILLFNDYKVAKIADFGLTRKKRKIKIADFDLSTEDADKTEPFSSTSLFGIFGYDAPEFVTSGEPSWRADVYRFGVVLLELLTGREPELLVRWAKPLLTEGKVQRCVDARLNGDYPPKAATEMAEIACLCVQSDAYSRPKMSIVGKALQSLLDA